MIRSKGLALLSLFLLTCGSDEGLPIGGSSTGGEANRVCEKGDTAGEVQKPTFWKNLKGETSWFASPIVKDLDGDGQNELIAAYYSVFVFDHQGELLAKADGGEGRIYAPHAVVDLEGDGIEDIIYGNGHEVYVYEWKNKKLELKNGFPVSTTSGDQKPEVRGLAVADLDKNGSIEIVVTTTQTTKTKDGGAQVFVFSAKGKTYQPANTDFPAWPRYNRNKGEGGDADRNGMGHNGYGAFGLNLAIGNIDDDKELEIIATYDNHHIQAFNHDGVAINASPWFTNRDSDFKDERLTWGQFIRWADPEVEKKHYHDHTGEWPHPDNAEWLQWTASPPNIVDLDGDGKNEVLGIPNIEKNTPYQTQAYAPMVLQGNYGEGQDSAMRLPGWEQLPRGGKPLELDGYYPPKGIPAATTVDIQGDAKPEIIVSLNDGFIHAFDASSKEIWKFNYGHGKQIMYASEVTVADLNQDGSPELLFTTYGAPDLLDSGNLVILAANGKLLYDISLPNTGNNGNGNGAPAAPAIGDLTGDGNLEIFVQTFEHGMDVFRVPGSANNCLLWPTARGGNLRLGQPSK